MVMKQDKKLNQTSSLSSSYLAVVKYLFYSISLKKNPLLIKTAAAQLPRTSLFKLEPF